MKRNRIILAIMKKEIFDILKTFKVMMIMGLLAFNFAMYITDTNIFELGIRGEELSYQFGTSMIYLVAMTILFIGNMLVNRLFYDEKRTKTIHVLLSMGVHKTIIWVAKLFAIYLVCQVMGILSILIHYLVIYFFFGVMIKFTMLTFVVTVITIPFLCYGSLALISVAYMYFARMNLVGMFLQIVPYLLIWEASAKIINISEIPNVVIVLSFLCALVCILVASVFMKMVPKEKIITRVD